MLLKLIIVLALAAGLVLMLRRGAVRRSRMPPAEARALLGLDAGAGAAEVREAHRRLIARVHPDAGGSAELAVRVNAARDALLDELKRK